MMLHSLRFRLIFMFMLVVMVAVGTVALFASQATTDNLRVYNQAKDDQQVISMMLTAYNQHQSPSALQKLAEQLAHSSQQRIILFDHQRRVLADSDRKLIGQVLSPERGSDLSMGSPSSFSGGTSISLAPPVVTSSLLSSPLYIPTDLSSQPHGHGIVISLQGIATSTNTSPEASFLTAVNHALWLAILIAGLTALLLALVFAHT
ncbi:MAG TPA: hypothetical protein VH164_14110, partial [Ktedonobacteraceae bacterium]|nr:hypothetical protein [Ktedonobacteraceae bacterium]